MEIIRKTICLEKNKSHVNSGLPYIQCNGNGNILTCDTTTIVDKEHDTIIEKEYHTNNFGNFQCDIDITNPLFNQITALTTTLQVPGEDYIRTTNFFKRYNDLLEILRTSSHLKHVKNEGCKDTGTHTDTYLGKFVYDGTTYDFLREAEVVPMFDEDGNENFINLGNGLYESSYQNSADYVIVIDDYQQFQNDGGKPLISFVDGLLVNTETGTSISRTSGFIAPYISIPLLLTCDENSLGVMTPYTDENDFVYSGEVSYDIANKYNDNIDGDTSIYDGVSDYWKIKQQNLTDVSALTNEIVVESKLSTLRIPKYFTSDDNETLPGLFVESQNSFFTNCVKTENGWTGTSISGEGLKCADGEDLNSNGYHTLMLFNSLDKYGEVPSNAVFLVKYDNSEETPMVVPYIVGQVLNKTTNVFNGVSTYTGDYIVSIEESDYEITFEYIIGGEFNSDYTVHIENTGIYYKESYPYKKSVSATTIIDEVETIYWYNKIDFDTKSRVVYSQDLNLNRVTLETTVKDMKLGDVWRTDETVINTPLIKEDYLMAASMDAVTDIDVTIDRGNATAFERHLILSECNTYSDLENYKNNIFNL